VVKGFELAEALNAQGFKQHLVDKLRSSDTRANELASAQSYGGKTATIFKAWRGSTVMAAPATFLPGDCSTRPQQRCILTAQPPSSSREDRGYDRSTFYSLRDLCRADASYQRNFRLLATTTTSTIMI